MNRKSYSTTRGSSNEDRRNPGVQAAITTGGMEARWGLETGLEGVQREQDSFNGYP